MLCVQADVSLIMAVGYSCMHLVGIDDTECDGSIHKMCTRVHFQLMCIVTQSHIMVCIIRMCTSFVHALYIFIFVRACVHVCVRSCI